MHMTGPKLLLAFMAGCLLLPAACTPRGSGSGGADSADDDDSALDDDDATDDDDAAQTEWVYEGEGPELQHDCGEASGDSWGGCDGHCVGAADHLIFGPYATMPAGNYEATWRLKTNDGDRSSLHILQIDVTTEQGSIYLAEHRIDRSEFSAAEVWREFSLAFSHDGTGTLEYRVQFIDTHRPCVSIDWIRINAR